MVQHCNVFALLPSVVAIRLQAAHKHVHGDLHHVLSTGTLEVGRVRKEKKKKKKKSTPHKIWEQLLMKNEISFYSNCACDLMLHCAAFRFLELHPTAVCLCDTFPCWIFFIFKILWV